VRLIQWFVRFFQFLSYYKLFLFSICFICLCVYVINTLCFLFLLIRHISTWLWPSLFFCSYQILMRNKQLSLLVINCF
jgi:hypothetical protein